MKISIAMATYNGAKYLQEQLDSFVAQTRLPDELVVCDDCSTDETVEILRRFAATAPFEVRVFVNEKNLGYVQNFGRALALCTGDLIFLSDQDDVWFSEKLSAIEKLATEDTYTQIFMNDAELVRHDLSPTGLTFQSQIKSAGIPESGFVPGCCMAIRQDFLMHLLPIPSEFKGHDVWLSKFGEGLKRRRIISQLLQVYRRHESTSTDDMPHQPRKINNFDKISQRVYTILSRIKNPGSDDLIQALYSEEAQIIASDKWIEETQDSRLEVQLREFKVSLQKSKQALDERMKIRKMTFGYRILHGWNFYRKNGYQRFSGTSSYLRDIFLR